VLLEGEKHALLGVSQPEAHISTLPFSAWSSYLNPAI
jgi:hypothetical protein